jgi:hypothetical protein
MAGTSRTLKLALLAEVADFTRNIGKAGTDTKTLGDQFEAFGRKASLAFAAAGAAIGAYAKQAIENAAADEKAQRNLALTIENTTSATAAQVAGVEKYISTTSLAIGITDDQLRPAFGRLVRSTKDVEDAQKLLNLALDVSAATGRPLEAVANALGKAYDGNLNALGRLGLGIDASILKSKDFDLVFNTLTDTFGGFAANEALSTEAAFARIKIAGDEIQEQIGAALLPVIQELTTFILEDVVPVVQSFVDGLTGQDGLTTGLSESQISAIEWGKKVRGLINTIIEFKDELLIVAGIIGTIFLANKIAAGVTATIALIRSLTVAYAALRNTALAAAIATRFAANPLLGLGAAAAIAGAIYAASRIFDGQNSMDAPDTDSIPFIDNFGPSDLATTTTTTTPRTTTTTTPRTTTTTTPRTTTSAANNAITSVVANAATVTQRAGQVVTDIAGAFDNFTSGTTTLAGIEAASNRPFWAGTSGVNTNSLAGIMAASNPPTINLTVNGAMDSEGTARTIVDTLNASYYRGTSGAGSLQFP